MRAPKIVLLCSTKKITMIRIALILLFPFLSIAQTPGYYGDIDFTQTGEALKIQLAQLITTTHTTEIYYTSSAFDVWDALKQTDLNPENTQDVFLLYGYDNTDQITSNDHDRDLTLSCHQSGCIGLWNREHVYPKSLATPVLETSSPGAGTDVHSLRSCDGQMNSSRNNRPFEDGEGNAHITATTGNWYPGDEWKGDVARMIMYMYLRYPTQCVANNVGIGGSTFAPLGDMPDIFLEWNEEDPVSIYEISRNDLLEGFQGNRNPFIDNPYLATAIWNGPEAVDAWGTLDIGDFEWINEVVAYPTITKDYVYITNPSYREYNYNVHNQLGQLLSSGKTKEKIDLSPYQQGIYFITILYKDIKKTFRVGRI